MASLRDTVKEYHEELRDGIAWVAFWKTGRSWNAEDFHLKLGDYLYPEDRSRMEEIKQADPAAVVINGYYSGYLGEDRNLDELTAGVRRHYENGYSNIGESGNLSKPTTTDCRRSLSRKQEPPPTLRSFRSLKKPTGTAKNPTPIYLTGA